MSESDGIDEAVEAGLRTGLMAASRLGEQLARMRETGLRQQQAVDEQQGKESQQRFAAERSAAQSQLAPTADSRWWDHARPEDIERVHETAAAWKDFDPAAQDAAGRIKHEVAQRYGVDVDHPGADEQRVSEAVAEAERNRSQAGRERGYSNSEGAETAELLAEASRENTGRERAATVDTQHVPATLTSADIPYDSDERRQSFAASLDGKADSETINARILADKDQATPPSAAVATEPGRTPQARRQKSDAGQARMADKGVSR